MGVGVIVDIFVYWYVFMMINIIKRVHLILKFMPTVSV